MMHNPHDFNARIYVAAYQARRAEEAALRNVPLVDRLGAPLVRRDMDVLLAIFLGLVAGGFIWLAVL